MKLPRKSGAVALGLISAGTVGLLLWSLQQDPGNPWRRLADGSTVRIVGVTYGTQHRVTEGTIQERLLQNLLPVRSPIRSRGGRRVYPANVPAFRRAALALSNPPSSVQGYFGAWRSEWETPAPELLVWLRHRTQARQWSPPDFEVEDEHGCRFPATNFWLQPYPKYGTLDVVKLDVFPQRGNPFRLVPRNPAQRPDDPIALTIHAPEFERPRDWSPEAVPQSREYGDHCFRFLGWKGGRPTPIARFEVQENGRLTRDWEPITVTASDATGNSATTPREREPQLDPTQIIFNGLCRYEPAWKLHVEFAPALPLDPGGVPLHPGSNASPAVAPSWTSKTRIPAPGPARKPISAARLSRPELQLELLNVAPKGAPSEHLWDKRPLRCPSVCLRMQGAKVPVRLTLVRVTDEKGRAAIPQWQEEPLRSQWNPYVPRPSQLFRPGDEGRTFALPHLPGAKTLSLEFVAHRAVAVDYLVAPPRPD